MGWIVVSGPCFVCRRIFSFNPHRVPSFPDPKTGEREPICESCILLVNEKRKAAGLEQWPVYEDSYEAIPEHEL